MTLSHLTLPWSWSDCDDPTQCEKAVHFPSNAETANSYPREWLEAAADEWIITEHEIIVFNEEGLPHNVSGPAVEYADSGKEWLLNGKLHREDGPASISADGDKEWWVDGHRHREDGPAVEHVDGTKQWWVNGRFHREETPG